MRRFVRTHSPLLQSEVGSSSILADANHRVAQHDILRTRSGSITITCDSQNRLVLEGRLPSYYLKQVLQTILRDVDGVQGIENRVCVGDP